MNTKPSSCNQTPTRQPYSACKLSEETIKAIGKLVGVNTQSSPTSVAQMPSASNDVADDYETFRNKVDDLTKRFLTETAGFARMHMQFCMSMQIEPTDVKFAMEQFARESAQGPSLYIPLHANDDTEDDSEWMEDDSSQSNNESDNDEDQDIDHDLDLDRTYFRVDRAMRNCFDECDEEGESWITRPEEYPSPMFDTMFPVLPDKDDFFKLSDWNFECMCRELICDEFREDLQLIGDSSKIWKHALLRFVLVECLR